MNLRVIIGIAAIFTLNGAALAANPHEGKVLTDKNCYQCHGTEVYTRKDRKVTSRPGLTKQVQRCEQALGLTWFDDQIENVAEYLNRDFYKFK